jgi:hypothetical protein
MLRERANTILGRYKEIKKDLEERREENRNLRR